ncbi:hypothetical protein RHRU231_450063 [Rhodococcus ruber]|uniref:Uncharacterized protein n=1 Tax=Rhodococcus ruber TaxID=1830 RepID=A0A098BMF2_9NOCA|nr:hypothetical protein RHRU231_450063 [Rhodococcus ruber]
MAAACRVRGAVGRTSPRRRRGPWRVRLRALPAGRPSPRPRRRTPPRTGRRSSAGCSRGVPQSFRGKFGEDLGGAAADAEDAHVAVLSFDLGLGHVAEAAEELHGLVCDPLPGLDGGVLGEAHLGDEVAVTDEGSLDDPPAVHPRDVDAPCHLGEGALYRLPGDQGPAERLAVPAPGHGQIQAPLRARVGLGGEGDPLGDERLRDLREAAVLGSDEIRDRHAHTGERQFRSVGGTPAHLVQLARDGETRCALFDHEQRDTGGTGAAGAHSGDDEIGAAAGGDVGLGAVDDVVIAVADGGGGQVPDVGAAAGFGDREGADELTREGRGNPLADLRFVAGGDEVWQGDAAGEQGGEGAAGGAGLVEGLAHGEGVRRVAPGTADGLGESGAEQPESGGLLVQFAGQFTVALPRGEMRQDLAPDEGVDRRAQLAAFGGVPDAHSVYFLSGFAVPPPSRRTSGM